jgi:hypothetical protein
MAMCPSSGILYTKRSDIYNTGDMTLKGQSTFDVPASFYSDAWNVAQC